MSTTFLHKPGAERSGRARITTIRLFAVPAAALALFSILIVFNNLHGNAAPRPGGDRDVRLAEAVPALPGSPVLLRQAAPAQIHASSTVSTCAVDVALVLDESGSMNDDTYCWDCYLESDAEDFPSGYREYLPYADWICENQAPILDDQGYEMLVAEAEYFSYSTSLDRGGANDYRRDQYTFPNTFWMLQRTENAQASGYACRYDQRLECGAHLMLMPHTSDEDIPGNPTPYTPASRPAPRLDYQFDLPTAGRWYAWIRAQCGARYNPGTGIVDSCVVHWGLDGQWNPSDYPSTNSADFTERPGLTYFEQGSYGNHWDWVRLGSVNLTQAPHTINIWGGGSGFRLDKIVLTRNSEGPASVRTYADRAPSFIRDATPSWNDVRAQPYQTYYADHRYGGPPDTQGHGGQACHPCNPLYGQRFNVDLNGNGILDPDEINDLNGDGTITPDEICDNTLDDIFDDQQPIRSEQEAAKTFLRRARAHKDQAGFVAYGSSYDASLLRELNCINVAEPLHETIPDYPGVWDWDTSTPDPAWIWCYDHRKGNDGWTAPIDQRDPNLSLGSLVGAIESMSAEGHTNLAEGMMKGLDILRTEAPHYGREEATGVMVLLSDGIANRYPGDRLAFDTCLRSAPCCQDSSLWPGGAAQDCVIYYANQARDSGVIVHTISLGLNAEQNLLQAVSDRTGGRYYRAPDAQELDDIYDQIWTDLTETCFQLSIDKATPAIVHLGETFTVTIAVSSSAAFSATGIVVQDTIPPGTAFVAASGAYSPQAPQPGEAITWQIGQIPNDGAPVSVTLVLSVVQPLDDFAGRATVFSGRGLSATVEIGPGLAKPILHLSHSVAPQRVVGSQPFTYTIAVRNIGWDDARDVRLVDTLPLSTTFVSASGTYTPPHTLAGETVAWALGRLPVGGEPVTVTIVLSAAMPAGASVGERIELTNTARVSCTQAITTSSSVTVTVEAPMPHLLLSLSAAPDRVHAGQPFTFIIAVRNTGDSDAFGVRLVDTLPVSTTFVSASGTYAPSNPVAGEAVTWELGDMANDGVPVTVTMVLTAAMPAGANVGERIELANTAYVSCTQGISDSRSVTVVVEKQPPPLPHLLLSLSAAPDLVYAGQPFTTTIAVRNTGASGARDVRLVDTLPPGITFLSASGAHAPAHPLAGETMTWALGDMTNDGVPVMVTLVLAATTSPETVVLLNRAEISCTQGITASASAPVTVLDRSPLWWNAFLPVVFGH